MTTNHTPTPWKLYGTLNVRGLDGGMVANCFGEDDAAFIVRVVNAHDDLVASANDLLKVLQSRFMRTGCSVLEESAIKCLRAAIVKAEGR